MCIPTAPTLQCGLQHKATSATYQACRCRFFYINEKSSINFFTIFPAHFSYLCPLVSERQKEQKKIFQKVPPKTENHVHWIVKDKGTEKILKKFPPKTKNHVHWIVKGQKSHSERSVNDGNSKNY